MEKKTLPLEFLLETGLLFEINRKILHPLGLALSLYLNDKGEVFDMEILDMRDDEEGVRYSDDTYAIGCDKFFKYMEAHGKKAIHGRFKKLGYILQGENV